MLKKLGKARHLSYLSRRLIDQPLAIEESAGRQVIAALGERLGIDKLAFDDDFDMGAPVEAETEGRGYEVCEGTAIIPVIGELCHRGGYLDAMSGLTSYTSIVASVRKAMLDDNVKNILLDIDSPGGEISGLYDATDAIASMRGKGKKIVAFSNERCFSAAYCLASAADEIWVSRTSGVGSIGVVCFHKDASKAYQMQGVRITPIYAGRHKVEGADFMALSAEAHARIQSEVDVAYKLFTGTVAKNRSMDEKAVKDTEAGCFYGDAAMSEGLADHVGSFGDALRVLGGQTETNPENNTNPGDATMADENEDVLAQDLFDADGSPVTINEDGEAVNEDGDVVAEVFDKEGAPVALHGEGEEEVLEGLTDDQGRLIDEEGNLIDEDGNPVDEDGNILDMEEEEAPAAKKNGKAKAADDEADKVAARRAGKAGSRAGSRMNAATAAGIVRVCNKAGHGEAAEGLIRQGASIADAQRFVARQAAISGLIRKAARVDGSLKNAKEASKVLKAANGSVGTARQILLDRLSGASAKTRINAHHAPGRAIVGGKDLAGDADAIYARRKAAQAAALKK